MLMVDANDGHTSDKPVLGIRFFRSERMTRFPDPVKTDSHLINAVDEHTSDEPVLVKRLFRLDERHGYQIR